MSLSISDHQQRVQRYLDAEARALEAQSMSRGDRRWQQAELDQIREGLREARADLAAAQRAAQGSVGPRVMVADFSRDLS